MEQVLSKKLDRNLDLISMKFIGASGNQVFGQFLEQVSWQMHCNTRLKKSYLNQRKEKLQNRTEQSGSHTCIITDSDFIREREFKVKVLPPTGLVTGKANEVEATNSLINKMMPQVISSERVKLLKYR